MVADPVVPDFTTGPVASCKPGEGWRTAFLGRVRGNKVSYLGNFVGLPGACAVNNNKCPGTGEIGFQGLKGVDFYGALIEASMRDVGFFGVGKKGVASCAVRSAA